MGSVRSVRPEAHLSARQEYCCSIGKPRQRKCRRRDMARVAEMLKGAWISTAAAAAALARAAGNLACTNRSIKRKAGRRPRPGCFAWSAPERTLQRQRNAGRSRNQARFHRISRSPETKATRRDLPDCTANIRRKTEAICKPYSLLLEHCADKTHQDLRTNCPTGLRPCSEKSNHRTPGPKSRHL